MPGLPDDVAELLRERIMQGRYAAGAPLSQRRLGEELSVSRSVVAEALRILQREGLVTSAPPGRGMRVAADDFSTLLSAYAMREVVDGLAARLAAARSGPALERLLLAAIDDQRDALAVVDARRYGRANVAFHTALIEASGNPLVLSSRTLLRGTARGAVVLGPQRGHEAVREHEDIFAAVRGHEPQRAEEAARAHVRATVAALEGLNGSRS
jgi:DNA-binding GntR family transcriptional regulator